MRKNDTQDLKSIIRDMLKANKLEHRFNAGEIEDKWPEVVGHLFSKYTSKVALRGKTLYVTMTSSAARQELSMAKKHLISSLNEKFNAEVINEIIFY